MSLMVQGAPVATKAAQASMRGDLAMARRCHVSSFMRHRMHPDCVLIPVQTKDKKWVNVIVSTHLYNDDASPPSSTMYTAPNAQEER